MARLLLLQLLIVSGDAQVRRPRPAPAKPAATTSWPIQSLSVEGNRSHSSERILGVAALKIGQLAGKREFEAARDRLLATGRFESVGYRFEPAADGKGFAASFQVVELQPVFPFRFEDLPAAPEQLEQRLKQADPLLETTMPATELILSRYAGLIEEYLAQQGKPEKVIGKLTADSPEKLVIVFRPAAAAPSVADVQFTGTAVLPATTLRAAIAGVAVGAVYSEARFRQFLDTTIRPLYEARGRIRVRFPSLDTEKAQDVKGIVVKVKVEEGESYSLGEVRLDGGPAELLKAGSFKSGDLANFNEIKAGIERIHSAMRRNGYMRVTSAVDRRINDEKKTVDLTIQLQPGPQFVFGKLSVQGLDIQTEPHIRKLWALKEGKPFNAEYPDFFLARLREDGVLDNLGKTRSAIKVNEQDRTVDVTLIFEGGERPEGSERPKPR